MSLTGLRTWLERTVVWRVWERMLEIEFVDRSVALAGKAFVSFFPLVIVVAAFMPDSVQESMIRTVTVRLGLDGPALATVQDSFASSGDVREATGVLGLVLTIFFASSFTTALQRVYFHTWRRPRKGGIGVYWRSVVCLLAVLVAMAILGAVGRAVSGAAAVGFLVVVALVVTSALWCFSAWLLLLGDVRARVLIPTGIITAVVTSLYAGSARIWMPGVVESNEAQFGVFGVALALITWFSGAAICVLIGATAGVVLAEDPGRLGDIVRGTDARTLVDGAEAPLPSPTREFSLRDAFQSTDDT
jgi:membrane protein